MKFKNSIFVAGALVVMASCGENSTTGSETKDSTASASTVTAANSGTAKSVDVPASTRSSFEAKYPGASNVTWTYYDEPYTAVDWEWTGWPALDTNDYLVNYNWNGYDYYAWYDSEGNWVGSVAPITNYEGLPAPVSAALQKTFPDYTITSVDKENDKDREAYEIKLENGDNKAKALIATDGTVLKKKGPGGKEKMDVK